jgi:NTE family protein
MSKKVDLALQGGGAHGAYTWGVLDRLLEEKKLTIDAISGTSAGAMNAAILANGYARAGREGAKQDLAEFWKRISDAAAFSPLQKNPIDRFLTGWNLDSTPAYHMMDMLSRVFSPYTTNPLNFNPLRDVLESMLDFELMHKQSEIGLFITATHVTSGQARIFSCKELH